MRVHPLVGALLTVLAVVGFRGGSVWLQLRKQDAKCRDDYGARLSNHGAIPLDDAARLFQENHPLCFTAASEWDLRHVRFDERRYEACLDAIPARHWASRITLAGGETIEQDPFFPGSWRTYFTVSGDPPARFSLRYETTCDGELLPGPSSNVFNRSSASGGTGNRSELVIPKLHSRLCTGNAAVRVLPVVGDWPAGPPLLVPLPREAEAQGEPAVPAGAQ